MSASEVQPPSLTVAAVSVQPPTAAAAAAAPPPPPRAGTAVAAIADVAVEPPAAPQDAVVHKPLRWRTSVTGYIVLAVGSVLAVLIPHLRLRAGIGEDALVILSIASMLIGMGGVVAGFLLNALRQL
ncbi:MAG TPA: hypothetical protein VH475_22730 [Tepidisphaeraceae bacterium]|jgi:hypothetical protein